jgi:hypothetical protein
MALVESDSIWRKERDMINIFFRFHLCAPRGTEPPRSTDCTIYTTVQNWIYVCFPKCVTAPMAWAIVA